MKYLKVNGFLSIMKFFNDTLFNITEGSAISNCLVCTLSTLISWANFVLPIKCECRHSTGDYFVQPTFSRNIRRMWVSYAFCVVTICCLIINFIVIAEICTFHQKFHCLMTVTDEVFGVLGVCTALSTSMQIQYWLNDLNMWSFIVDKRSKFGAKNVISATFCRKFYIASVFAKCFVYLGLVSFTSLYIYFIVLNGFTRTTLCKAFTWYSSCVRINFYTTIAYIVALKRCLDRKLRNNFVRKLRRFTRFTDNGESLLEFLQKYGNYILYRKMTTNQMNRYINPGFIIFYLVMESIIILNIYIFIIEWDHNYILDVRILQARTVDLIFVVIYISTYIDLSKVVS